MEMTACVLNGLQLTVPSQYLDMVAHCRIGESPQPTYDVETRHFMWSLEHVGPGDTALDIGASVGLFSAGLSRKVGNRGRVYAFEPARRAEAMLRATVAANQLANVWVEACAISDVPGTAEFYELPNDKDCTWRAEASALKVVDANVALPETKTYEVPVTTVDAFLSKQPRRWFRRPSVRLIKIDIEGFEAHALRGAAETLSRDRPHLAIDIHQRLAGSGDTDPDVRLILGPLKYSFERIGHVLLCSPG